MQLRPSGFRLYLGLSIKNKGTPGTYPHQNDMENYIFIHSEQRIDLNGGNGGAEIATINQAVAIAKTGSKVVVAARLANREGSYQGVYFKDLGDNYDVLGLLRWLDAVYPEEEWNFMVVGRAASLIVVRAFLRIRSIVFISHSQNPQDSGFRGEMLARLADRIVCVSRAQRSKFCENGVREDKIAVIPNGIDREIFSAPRDDFRDYSRIVFSGALVYDKGVHLLITAFNNLKAKFPRITLDIYGSASLWGREPYFDEKAVERGSPGVKFHGAVSQREVASAFQGAAFVVAPSVWFDCLPFTCLEAQACGCPVVVSDIGGLPETVIDGVTGLVVPEINEDSLADTMLKLLSDQSQLQNMSKAAIEHIGRNFTWERAVGALMRLADEAAKERSQMTKRAPSQSSVTIIREAEIQETYSGGELEHARSMAESLCDDRIFQLASEFRCK